VVAGEDELAASFGGLDGVGTVEYVVESSADDDVLVKGCVRDEFRVGFDGEG
jgi:hypothetical protein